MRILTTSLSGAAVRNGITLQFRKRGNWYEPMNQAAMDQCEVAGTDQMPGSRMPAVKRWFQVELV